jgi:hypothetical protein
MLELKKADDPIIDDKETRALLNALLGIWGDGDASFFRSVELELLRLDSFAEMRFSLDLDYSRESYNAAAGHKTDEPSEWREAQGRRIKEALALFQSSFGIVVKQSLLLAIEELARASSRTVTNEVEEKIEAEEKRHERERREDRKEFLAIWGIELRDSGRPEKFPPEYVEQRSIAIIQAIEAGERDRGKVALVFYAECDPTDTVEVVRIAAKYKAVDGPEKRNLRDKYSDLLSEKGLTYEGLRKKARID